MASPRILTGEYTASELPVAENFTGYYVDTIDAGRMYSDGGKWLSIADSASIVIPASAPRNVRAFAKNSSIKVTWSPPLYGKVSSYLVTVSPGNATTTTITPSATIGGLANGTAYTATVVAVNASGKGSSVIADAVTPNSNSAVLSAVASADLFAWYAADQIVTPPANGNPLISGSGGLGIYLNDASGNGKHVTSISSVPTMVSSWTNSKPALNFNGNGNYIKLPFNTQTWNGQCTLFIVGSLTALTNTAGQYDQHLFANYSYNGSSFSYSPYASRIDMVGDSSAYASIRQQSTNAINSTTGDDHLNGVSSIKTGSPFVSSTVFSGYQFFNGNKATNLVYNVSSCPNVLLIGARGDVANASRFYNGRVAEMLLYLGAMSDSDRHKIEAALGTKYGVTMAVS